MSKQAMPRWRTMLSPQEHHEVAKLDAEIARQAAELRASQRAIMAPLLKARATIAQRANIRMIRAARAKRPTPSDDRTTAAA